MPFAVEDFQDLIRLLDAHPDWRRDLRRIVLTDDILALPEAVRGLVAAQERTEARLQALAAAQERTEARLAALGEQVTALAAAQERTEARLQALIAAQERTEARLDRVEVRLGRLEGSDLARRFADRAPAYLGSQGYKRVRVVPTADWADLIDDAVDQGQVTAAERNDLLRADSIIRARDHEDEVWLVAEVSVTVDAHDVTRARRRAAVLARLRGRARPCVAGYAFTTGAEEERAADVLALTLPED